MSHPPASLRGLALIAALASLLGRPDALHAQTWLDYTTDNNYNTATNWSTGAAPAASTSSVAVFGVSTVTQIDLPSITLGAFQFESTASAYAFTAVGTGMRITLAGAGVVNQSSHRPTFYIGAQQTLRLLTTATLGDAIVNLHGFTGLDPATLTLNAGTSAGTAIINIGDNGNVAFSGGGTTTPRSDGSGARFVLSGTGVVGVGNEASTPMLLGSIEGSGVIDARLGGVTTGQLGTDTTFAGQITGTAAFTKTGAGTLTLTGTITAAATMQVTGGALAIAANDRLGTGALTLDGGALRANAAFDDLRAITLGDAGGTLDTQGYSFTHSSGLSGSGAFTKTGTGTLLLSAANTHSGGTRIAAGTLAVGHDTALGTGTVHLDGGTLSASGSSRSLANAVSLNADSTIGGSQALMFTGGWTLARNRDLTVTNTALTIIAGVIAESGGPRALAKFGAGLLEVTNANIYTGGTLIAEGTMKINNATGSAFGTGAVTVVDGATLTGAGSFTGAFQNNGIYAPGNSPTLATLSSFSQGSTGILEMEIAGLLPGTGYDVLNVTGSLTFGGTLAVTFLDGFTAHGGETFDFFDWGSASGTFATLDLPTLATGLSWETSALYTSGELSITGAAIPEPSTYAVVLASAALAVAMYRRRQRALT